MSRRLLIAIPCYSGQVHADTMMTVIDGIQEAVGILGFSGANVETHNGDARIIHCRNQILNDFLASGFSDLVMIDADVAAEPGSLAKLLRHPVDMVAGCYPDRNTGKTYQVRWLKDETEGVHYLPEDSVTGLLEVAGAATGFMHVTRRCAEAMAAHYRQGMYPHGGKRRANVMINRLFDHDPTKSEDWGEDYMFCQRWRDLGGKVYIDPTLRLTHIGYHRFTGAVQDWLQFHDTSGDVRRVLHRAPPNGHGGHAEVRP